MTSNGKVKYSSASQIDPGCLEVEVEARSHPLDKTNQSCFQRCAFYTCLLGFAFIIIGIICAFVMKPVIEKKILQKLPLVEGEQVFLGWKTPPVTPVLFLRMFNLTNEAEFLAGREKAKLVELGPYAYRQKMQKTNIEFTGSEAVRHEVRRRYDFSPELSGGAESDIVIVPNLPLFGAMKKMAGESGFAKDVFKTILGSYEFAKDTKPFLKLTVKEFLWGYPSLILSIARNNAQGCSDSSRGASEPEWEDFNDWGFDYEANRPKKAELAAAAAARGAGEAAGDQAREAKPRPECDITPENMAKFGVFRDRNGTSLDPREINTGTANLTEKGLMISWHDMRRLQYWGESPPGCNVISASRDPGVLPINLQKQDALPLFIGNLGRTIEFKYTHEVKVDQFRAFRYIPKESSFDSPADSPSNACYCVRRSCLPTGLHDLSTAQPLSPVVMSWPHFLYGDPDLKHAVEGLYPDAKKHTFYLDVEPKYGITLTALAKLQMNLEVTKNNGFGYFDNIKGDKVFLPFAWIEEGVLGPSEVVTDKVQMLLRTPDAVRNLMALIGMGLGILMLIPEIFFWARSCCRSKPDPGNVDEEEVAVVAVKEAS